MARCVKMAQINQVAANQGDIILSSGASNNGSPYAEEIFSSLRSIFRATLLHYRELESRYHLTGPQMVLLRRLHQRGPTSPGDLARDVFLSQATVSGILDRLETAGLVERKREHADRRRVTVHLSDHGADLAQAMPVPLQETFAASLSTLPLEQQAEINTTLGLIAKMMYAAGEPADLNDTTAQPALPKD
jgi:DNA-binding MarR family transcriptional regulator